MGGQIESERDTVRAARPSSAAFAVVLVLTVLAAQFRRLRVAVLVLASVPVAIVGALGALLVTAHAAQRVVADGLRAARRASS